MIDFYDFNLGLHAFKLKFDSLQRDITFVTPIRKSR